MIIGGAETKMAKKEKKDSSPETEKETVKKVEKRSIKELKKKLKQPIDFTKFKQIRDPKIQRILKIVGLAILGIVLVFTLVVGIGIYGFDWNNNFTKTTSKYIPYPATLVGGNSVRLSEYFEEVYHAETYFKKSGIEPVEGYKTMILDRLIDRVLFQKQAKSYGVIVSQEEIDAQFNQEAEEMGGEKKLAEVLRDLYDYDIKSFKKLIYYKLLEDRLRETVPVRIHAQHILVKIDEGADEDTVKKAQEKALELYKKVTEGKEDFGTVAGEFSEDEASRESGGDLGFFGIGQFVSEFEVVALKTKVGEITQPVRSKFGFHIIKVLERKGEVEKSFDDWFSDIKKSTKTIELIKLK